jgi:hypothetical protein
LITNVGSVLRRDIRERLTTTALGTGRFHSTGVTCVAIRGVFDGGRECDAAESLLKGSCFLNGSGVALA